MAEKSYYTIAEAGRHEIKVKRSTFIGSLSAAADRESAEAFVSKIRQEFHDAAHNCFAYRIDENEYRYSDDGEPSSTAGKPILSMIDKYELLRSVLVVTRYFGGIKLGIGGLIHAYSQSAENTIQRTKRIQLIAYDLLRIHYPYQLTRHFQYILEKHHGVVKHSRFDESVTSLINIPTGERAAFEQELIQSGSGRIQIFDESE